MTHYHVYEAASAMTTGFRRLDQARAHGRKHKGSRIVACTLAECDRFYGLRDENGDPDPRSPLTGRKASERLIGGMR